MCSIFDVHISNKSYIGSNSSSIPKYNSIRTGGRKLQKCVQRELKWKRYHQSFFTNKIQYIRISGYDIIDNPIPMMCLLKNDQCKSTLFSNLHPVVPASELNASSRFEYLVNIRVHGKNIIQSFLIDHGRRHK